MRLMLLSILCFIAFETWANDSGLYFGINQTDISTNSTFYEYFNYRASVKIKPKSVIFGYAANDLVAIEARLSPNATDDTIPANNGWPQSVYSIDSMSSVLARFSIDASPIIKPYIVVGKTKFESSITFQDGEKIQSSKTSLTSGVGLSVKLMQSLIITLEQTKFVHEEPNKVEGKVLQLTYRF